MVGMTAVFVVAAIAVAGAVVARVTWRRPADERHSIQSHQQTLETLRSMADRRPDGQRERTAGPGTSAGAGSAVRSARSRGGPVPTGSVRSRPARPDSVRAPAPPAGNGNGNGNHELVFVDDATAAHPPRADGPTRVSPLALPRGLPRPSRGHRRGRTPRGLGPSRRSRGRLASVAAAAAVLALVVGAAVALAPSPHRAATKHAPAPRTKASAHAVHSRTTVTTAPLVRPTTATANTAAYGAPSTGYTIALRATGLCWVEATETSTGKVVWTGTLLTGQTQSIPATGTLVVRLGAANDVIVTLNGESVLLPAGFHSPFDMSFEST